MLLEAALHGDFASVLVDDAFGDPEAEAGSSDFLAGVEGLEKVLAHLGEEARASVADGDAETVLMAAGAAGGAQANVEFASLGHGVVGIAKEVVEDLAQVALKDHGFRGFAKPEMDVDFACSEARRVEAEDGRDGLLEVDGGRGGQLAMELKSLEGDVGDARDLLLGEGGIGAHVVWILGDADEIEEVDDGFERIVDLVGDGAGELADGGELLAAAQGFFREAGLSAIAEGDDRAGCFALLDDGLCRHLGVEEGPILAEEVLLLIGEGLVIAEDVIDAAFFSWVGTSVGKVMVDHAVHVLSDELRGGEAEHGERSAIDKGTGAV